MTTTSLPTEPVPDQAGTDLVSKIIGAVGKLLIGLGLLVIAFAAFQLWGTGLLEEQSQKGLAEDFDERVAELEAVGLAVTAPPEPASSASDDGATGADASTGPLSEADQFSAANAYANRPRLGDPDGPDFEVVPIDPEELTIEQIAALTPERGEVLGKIEIPRIGLSRNLIEGVRRSDLREGPGHYEDTPLPGTPGNAAIAGHRTTYGSPFGDIDQLQPGDLVKVTTLQGEHYYEVLPHVGDDGEIRGHFIVEPNDVSVLADFGDNRITLTACHPKASSRLRIIVTAQLVSPPQPVIPALTDSERTELAGEPVEEFTLDEEEDDALVGVDENTLVSSLGWNLEERTPTILWGLAAAAVAGVGLAMRALTGRRLVWLGVAPMFLFVLFNCFVHLDRLLPAL